MSFSPQDNSSQSHRAGNFRRSQLVEVRSLEEILLTLDSEGKYDGMPFMPEMIKYCGRKFRVARRADHIFLDRYCYVARLKNTVFLGLLRCDGKAHDGCEMSCQLFWKEAWLKPAEPTVAKTKKKKSALPQKASQESAPQSQPALLPELPTRREDRYVCQATELVRASTRLPWWDLRQYAQQLMLGETTTFELLISLLSRAKNKFLGFFREKKYTVEGLHAQTTPSETLNLQPGEWVEVKSLPEIQATLDANGKNRGLGFASEQAFFCGKRYRVSGQVKKIILEWSGEMRDVTNTVKLEEITCNGRICRSCPRNCLHLWREIWLRRVSGPA
ncbi:MAG: hypothetical protein ACWGMZ_12995 [Thermoguttaceae bacterium]